MISHRGWQTCHPFRWRVGDAGAWSTKQGTRSWMNSPEVWLAQLRHHPDGSVPTMVSTLRNPLQGAQICLLCIHIWGQSCLAKISMSCWLPPVLHRFRQGKPDLRWDLRCATRSGRPSTSPRPADKGLFAAIWTQLVCGVAPQKLSEKTSQTSFFSHEQKFRARLGKEQRCPKHVEWIQ